MRVALQASTSRTLAHWLCLAWAIIFPSSWLAAQSKLPAGGRDKDKPASKIYLIGNSLTWDCVPAALGGQVSWHVDCGKSLQQIFDHPEKPCVPSSKKWPETLAAEKFDYLCIQPHYGTTLEQDARLIDHWMTLQPQAIIVLHTGWARQADFHSELDRVPADKPANEAAMSHSIGYFAALEHQLRTRHPASKLRRTAAITAIKHILEDIAAHQGPLKSVDEFYRDAIHLNVQAGRYLAHNCLRRALDQPPSSRGFQLEPELQNYLDATIDKAVAEEAAAKP